MIKRMSGRPMICAAAMAILACAAAPYVLSAGEPKAEIRKAPKDAWTVADLKWMSGDWKGQIFGGPIRERWHEPAGEVMLGTSTMGLTRERAMYELMVIEEKDGAPTMFLRHFRQYLATNETAPMEFRLTSLSKKKAVFESEDKSHTFSRIVYERTSKEELMVRLEGERDGKPTSIESRMAPASK